LQGIGHASQLLACVVEVGHDKERTNRRGHHRLVPLGNVGQQVAHEVYSAALPSRAGQNLAEGVLEPFMSIAGDQLNLLQASLLELAQELQSERFILAGADIKAKDIPVAAGAYTNGDDHGLADDAVVLPHFEIQCIEPQVGITLGQRPLAKHGYGFIQRLTDPANLTLVDAGQAQRLQEVVHLSGADPLDVCLLHYSQQCFLRPATWVEQTGKVCPTSHLRNSQRDFAHARLPDPVAITIALCLKTVTPLVPSGANLFADFQFHYPLAEQADAFTEKVNIFVQAMLAQQLQECHTDFGHRALLFVHWSLLLGNTR
jgi:hypothetical protein